MIRVRGIAFAGALVVMTAGASAQELNDYWAGPYFGMTYGWGQGNAHYEFNTDGWYNDNAGDTYDQALSGNPIGIVLGFNWRPASGPLVYGVEAFFHTHGVSAAGSCLVLFPRPPENGPCGDESPFDPDHEFDVKGHWFGGVNFRIGYAYNRLLAYAQGGIVMGHIVNSMQDLDTEIHITEYKAPASAFGVTGEIGIEYALGPRFAIGIGIRGTYLSPLAVNAESIDNDTGDPAGAQTSTNHSIRLASHAIVARLTFHGGNGAVENRNIVPFGWNGGYWGIYIGALWQAGFQLGYDRVFNGNFLAGFSVQTSVNVCCGISVEATLNGRVGYILRDDILVYAEAGYSYHSGTFFDVIDGGYYAYGLGIEMAFTPRITGFLEFKRGGQFGTGFIDGNVQAGVNFRVGRR